MRNLTISVTEIVEGAFNQSDIEVDFIKHLGDGSFGSVELIGCQNFVVKASKLLALKHFKGDEKSFKYELSRFTKMQQSINHTFINKAYGYSISKDKDCILLLEYINGGTLWEIIKNFPKDRTTPYLLGFCLAEISEGLCMMHKIGLVHQDLHMGNVLVRSNGHLVIGDFGLAGSLINPYTPRHKEINAGNSLHYAPELRREDEQFICQSVDYFSLGVMVYFIATRHDPADPLWPDYRRFKDHMFDDVYPSFRRCLQGLMDPSKHTRLCNGSVGNIPLLQTDGMRSTIWNKLGSKLCVEEVKQKIRDLGLSSPFERA